MDTKQAVWIPNLGLFGILGCHLATLLQPASVIEWCLLEEAIFPLDAFNWSFGCGWCFALLLFFAQLTQVRGSEQLIT